jgi:hypothetical protein
VDVDSSLVMSCSSVCSSSCNSDSWRALSSLAKGRSLSSYHRLQLQAGQAASHHRKKTPGARRQQLAVCCRRKLSSSPQVSKKVEQQLLVALRFLRFHLLFSFQQHLQESVELAQLQVLLVPLEKLLHLLYYRQRAAQLRVRCAAQHLCTAARGPSMRLARQGHKTNTAATSLHQGTNGT